MPDLNMQPLDLHYTTMTQYDKNFRKVHVIFENDNLKTLEYCPTHGRTLSFA